MIDFHAATTLCPELIWICLHSAIVLPLARLFFRFLFLSLPLHCSQSSFKIPWCCWPLSAGGALAWAGVCGFQPPSDMNAKNVQGGFRQTLGSHSEEKLFFWRSFISRVLFDAAILYSTELSTRDYGEYLWIRLPFNPSFGLRRGRALSLCVCRRKKWREIVEVMAEMIGQSGLYESYRSRSHHWSPPPLPRLLGWERVTSASLSL